MIRIFTPVVFISFLWIFMIQTAFADDKKEFHGMLFTALFWEKYQSETFSYAPWGNEQEANASIVDFSVGSNSLSKKFVYHGKGTMNLYEKKRLEEWEAPREEERKPLFSGQLAAQFDLPQSNEKIKEYVLLFLNKKNDGLWKIYPIPFTTEEIPSGNYKFISQSRIPLYIIVGTQKFILQPGKSKVTPLVVEQGARRVPIKVLSQKNGTYVELYNQQWSHSKNVRGLCFIGFQNNKINLKRTSEFTQPIERAIGYNLQPVSDIEEKTKVTDIELKN